MTAKLALSFLRSPPVVDVLLIGKSSMVLLHLVPVLKLISSVVTIFRLVSAGDPSVMRAKSRLLFKANKLLLVLEFSETNWGKQFFKQ